MLQYFRLVNSKDHRTLERQLKRPAIYVMCFDISGQLTRIGWSSYPGQRITNVLREQAADVLELWIAEIPIDEYFDPSYDYNTEHTARRFGRYLQLRLREHCVRNEFYRVSMRQVDAAFAATTQSGGHPDVMRALKAAA